MFIKTVTVRTEGKVYRYVRLMRYIQQYYLTNRRPGEEVACILGTVNEIIESRDTIIKGLLALKIDEPKPKKKNVRKKKSRHGSVKSV